MPHHDDNKAESGEDIEMEDDETARRVGEEGENAPQVIVEPPEGNDDKMEVDN